MGLGAHHPEPCMQVDLQGNVCVQITRYNCDHQGVIYYPHGIPYSSLFPETKTFSGVPFLFTHQVENELFH